MSRAAAGGLAGVSPKTVFLAAEQGFSARYLFRTHILPTLRHAGVRVVILSPHAGEPYFSQEFGRAGVIVESYQVEAGLAYLGRSSLHRRLRLLRDMTAKGTADLGTFEARRRRYEAQANWFRKITGRIASVPIPLLRRSRLLRKALVSLETALFTPVFHEALFVKYQPDLLVVASMGNMRGVDALLMREARRHNVKIASIVLSWDNTSTRGIGGANPDFIVAWTPTMKRELVEYYDVKEEQVFVGGVAHWDRYYSPDGPSRQELFRRFALDPEKKLLLFATASPTGWAELNVEIVKVLGTCVAEGRLARDCEVVVRLHPIYVSKRREGSARDSLRRLEEAAAPYPHVHIVRPKLRSQTVTFDLSSEDAEELTALLRHCDVVITSYSTMMLEACIFDKPVINVAFDTFSQRMGQRYTAVANYPHLKRVLKTGGTRTATTPDALIKCVNEYLQRPELDRDGRMIIRDNECGPFPGIAGRRIGEHLLALIDGEGCR